MLKYFYLPILCFSIYCFAGCKEKVVTVEVEKNTNKGGLLFKIDKANAPKNVVVVEAVLARQDADTIKASLNLLDDISADISLDNIQIGSWLLTVNAYDSLNTIVYTGSTELKVQDGVITQVNLTLVPTSTGFGSIYIFVNWGTVPSTVWNDYELNPVLPSLISSTSITICNQPKVLWDEGKFKMWFAVFKPGYAPNTGYAESYDGYTWNIIKINLFNLENIDSTNINRWDANCVVPGTIIKEAGIYKMYYGGFKDSYSIWQVGLAESSDGINWKRYSDPILKSTANEYRVSAGDIVKINGIYFMYYSFSSNPQTMPPAQIDKGISLAISNDGKTWTRYNGNPVLSNALSWSGKVYYPSVIVENDRYEMIFMDANASGFGMATSKDGYTWIQTAAKPFFTLADTRGAKPYEVAYPFWRKINNKYFLYYSSASKSDMITNTIRVAVK